ncbi:MAG: GldG family protein [Bdellovibrionales bacterium]|nr:GldG family protein [Bdellovibrionales bacterium]
MNPLSKLSLLIGAFCLIVLSATRFLLGAWHPFLYVILVLFLLSLVLSVVLDYRLYLDFLSVKTAQKGLSLGWSLLLLFIFLIAISYLSIYFDKSFDLTSEKLNSVSEQTQTALKKLDSPLTFYIFYKGDKVSNQIKALKQNLKMDLSLYREENSKVKIQFIDTYKNPVKAEEYLAFLPDKSQQDIFVFVNYKDKKIRVELPFDEEQLTSAVIKSQKREFKEILFLIGHGERDLNSSDPAGLQILNQALKDSGFKMKEWNFITEGVPQTNPVLIAVISPSKTFSLEEKNWLKEYLSKGGRLILALDPKQEHGLEDFLKEFALVYEDNYVVSQLSAIFGANVLTAFGSIFSKSHPITQKINRDDIVFFEKASSLSVLEEKKDSFEFSNLVQSHPKSAVFSSLFDPRKMLQSVFSKPEKLKSFNIVTSVRPKSEDKKEFELILMGDSDFLSNRYIHSGSNKDFILNTFVSLSGEEDLVSIRPKQPKGTKITLNRMEQVSLVLAYIVFPLIFLITGLLIWFRKRSA